MTPRAGELLPSATGRASPSSTPAARRARRGGRRIRASTRASRTDARARAGLGPRTGADCTMSAGAVALAYHTRGLDDLAPWGGDLRHRQGDLSGGRICTICARLGGVRRDAHDRRGAGWSAVVEAHDAGRAIVIQGEGNVPGLGIVQRWTRVRDRARDAERRRCGYSAIRSRPAGNGSRRRRSRRGRRAWQSSIAFAVSRVVAEAPDPAPEPKPPPPAPAPHTRAAELELAVELGAERAVGIASSALVGAWVRYLEAPAPSKPDAWGVGAWARPSSSSSGSRRRCGSVRAVRSGGWSRGPVPYPIADALEAIKTPAAWGGARGGPRYGTCSGDRARRALTHPRRRRDRGARLSDRATGIGDHRDRRDPPRARPARPAPVPLETLCIDPEQALRWAGIMRALRAHSRRRHCGPRKREPRALAGLLE